LAGHDAIAEQWRSSASRWSAFSFSKEALMSRSRAKSLMGKILDNILFLEEVFGDQADRDIPKLPVLEMARCFDLEPPRNVRVNRRQSKAWPLWK
jgi:hypothetical protein